jgi:DNA-binding NtrC family response regulator
VRVLLVDDEADYRETLAQVLRRRGLEVRTAADGEAALALHASESFEVILLDLRMPKLDGQHTLEELRQRDAHTQVLLLSGHADLAAARAALQAGAADVLLKPCPVETLLSAIADAAEVTRAARGVAAHRRGDGEP